MFDYFLLKRRIDNKQGRPALHLPASLNLVSTYINTITVTKSVFNMSPEIENTLTLAMYAVQYYQIKCALDLKALI